MLHLDVYLELPLRVERTRTPFALLEGELAVMLASLGRAVLSEPSRGLERLPAFTDAPMSAPSTARVFARRQKLGFCPCRRCGHLVVLIEIRDPSWLSSLMR